jgi:hypothetical protein
VNVAVRRASDERKLPADSVEKLRFNEWTSKFSITTAVTIRFCTNLHIQADRKRLLRPDFLASNELKFSKRVFQHYRRQAVIASHQMLAELRDTVARNYGLFAHCVVAKALIGWRTPYISVRHNHSIGPKRYRRSHQALRAIWHA